MNKHFIKHFKANAGYALNLGGYTIASCGNEDQVSKDIGTEIYDNIKQVYEADACYGVRIDYTITPITKDPFK